MAPSFAHHPMAPATVAAQIAAMETSGTQAAPADDSPAGEHPNTFLAESAPHIPEGPVLCLGADHGNSALHLASLGHPVVAIDRSPVALDRLRAAAEERGVEIETMAEDLAHCYIRPGWWSGIVALFAHLPPDLRGIVHRSAVQGLCPGGMFVLEGYSPAQLARGNGGPSQNWQLMNLDDLRRELRGLEFLVARELDRGMSGETAPERLASVVQILGRRRP